MRRDGKDVFDATGPLDWRVTPRDCKLGIPGDAGECALAHAGKRQPGVINVRVGADVVFVEFEDYIERYLLSPTDRKRIATYDEDQYFKPGRYQLMPPPPNRQIGARSQGASGSATRTGRVPNVDRAEPRRGRVSAGQLRTG